MNTKYFNHNLDGSDIPLSVGDRYYGQDRLRDFWNQREYIGMLTNFLMNYGNNNIIMQGCNCSQGAGHTLNSIIGKVIVKFQIKPPSSWVAVPPTMANVDIPIIVEVPALTNQAITGATTDGATVNYAKIAYNENSGSSRSRAVKVGSYDSEITTSYTFSCNSTPPTIYECTIATFTTDGANLTFTNEEIRYKNVNAGFISTKDIFMSGTDLKISPYVIDCNGTTYQSDDDTTIVDVTTLDVSSWYAVCVKESDGTLSVQKMTGNAVFDNWTITGNQLNALSIYDEFRNYCYDTISAVGYRILGVVLINSVPDDCDYIMPIANRPLDYAECESDTPQTFATTVWETVDYEDILIDINSCVTIGASWKFEPSVSGKYYIDAKVRFVSSDAWTQNESAIMRVIKNSSDISRLHYHIIQATFNGHEVQIQGNDCFIFDINDDISIQAYQSTGGNLSRTTGVYSNKIIIGELL